MADPAVDQQARNEVADVRHELAGHRQIMEIKLSSLMAEVKELKAQLKWAGGLVVMLFISTLTWSLAQQYSANEAQKKDMAQQIELLQAQDRSRAAYRQEVLSRLPAGAPESTDTALGAGEDTGEHRLRSRDRAKD